MHSYGTAIYYKVGSQWFELAEVVSITIDGVETTISDGFHLKSTDAFKTFLAGMHDGGEITFGYRHDSSAAAYPSPGPNAGGLNPFQAMSTLQYTRAAAYFGVIFPDSWNWTAPCIVRKGGNAELPEDDTVMGEITLKVNGKPVITNGVSFP